MKIRKICLYIFISIFFISNIINVYAATYDSSTGASEAASGTVCSSNQNCYSLGTGGIRITLLDKDGNKKTDSRGNPYTKDYWFYGPNVSFFEVGKDKKDIVLFRFAKTYLKQEIYNLITSNGQTSINYSTLRSLIIKENYSTSSYDFVKIEDDNIAPGILNGMQSDFDSTSDTYPGYLTNNNTRVANSTKKIADRLVANAKDEKFSGEVNQNASVKYIENILTDMGVTSLGEDDYLQIEPLTQWGNLSVNSNCGYTDAIFVGTPSEFIYISKGIRDSSVFNSWNASNIFNTGSGGNYICAFNPQANQRAYYNLATYGIYTNANIPNNILTPIYTPADVLGKNKDYAEEKYNVLSSTRALKSTYGVSFIRINDVLTGSCNDDARTIALNDSNKIKADYTKDNYIDKLYGTDTKYSKEIRKECFTNPNDKSTFNEEKCYQLMPDYINSVGGGIPERNINTDKAIDVCNPVSCEDSLYTIDSNGLKYNKNIVSASPSTKYDKAVAFIYNNIASKFSDNPKPSNDFLNYSVYHALHRPAVCDKKVKVCPLSDRSDFSCSKNSSNKKFTISDTTDDECIKEGYAYSGQSSVKGVVAESLIDLNYKNNDVYCFESVSFTLPGVPKKEKAGKLLGWGISKKVTENGYYGKMEVERVCKFNNFNSGKLDDINITWVKNIAKDTEILLNYHDKKNFVIDKKMNVNLSDFDVISYNGQLPDGFEERIHSGSKKVDVHGKELEDELTNYNCNDSSDKCKKLNILTLKATYSINYPSSLQWYADKINPFDPKSAEEIEAVEEPDNVEENYIPLGTGMLVSFADPTCDFEGTKQLYRSAEDLKSAESNNGELSVTIKNVGTRVYPNDPSRHHFDNILYLDITDKNGISDNMYSKGDKIEGRTGIYYNCPFSIENKLFGSEYGKKSNCEPPTDSGSPEGLDVVFRTVNLMKSDDIDSLLEAFPSRVGSGRLFGDNWFKLTNGSYFNTSIIYNILKEDVYKEDEPMYHIELTPSKIKSIREDNKALKDEGKNPYSNMDSDTYLFINNIYENDLLKTYDVEEDMDLDSSDASAILSCNAGTNTGPVCNNVDFGIEYGQKALEYYTLIQSGKLKLEKEVNIHVSSIYLDTLKEKHGLTGVCMDDNASGRLTKYKAGGCFYEDKPEIKVATDDIGKSFYFPAKVCEVNFAEKGETLYSCLSKWKTSGAAFEYTGEADDFNAMYDAYEAKVNEGKASKGDIQFTSDLNS